jgi:hypothetical protein
MRPLRTANLDILHRLCPDDIHNQSKDFEKCSDCGAVLCTICGTDRHYTGDGHDLNDPRYWGV